MRGKMDLNFASDIGKRPIFLITSMETVVKDEQPMTLKEVASLLIEWTDVGEEGGSSGHALPFGIWTKSSLRSTRRLVRPPTRRKALPMRCDASLTEKGSHRLQTCRGLIDDDEGPESVIPVSRL